MGGVATLKIIGKSYGKSTKGGCEVIRMRVRSDELCEVLGGWGRYAQNHQKILWKIYIGGCEVIWMRVKRGELCEVLEE